MKIRSLVEETDDFRIWTKRKDNPLSPPWVSPISGFRDLSSKSKFLTVFPEGYILGTPLNVDVTLPGTVFENLNRAGATSDSVSRTWAAGAESLTFQIGAVVPDPSSLGLLVLGGAMALRRKRR